VRRRFCSRDARNSIRSSRATERIGIFSQGPFPLLRIAYVQRTGKLEPTGALLQGSPCGLRTRLERLDQSRQRLHERSCIERLRQWNCEHRTAGTRVAQRQIRQAGGGRTLQPPQPAIREISRRIRASLPWRVPTRQSEQPRALRVSARPPVSAGMAAARLGTLVDQSAVWDALVHPPKFLLCLRMFSFRAPQISPRSSADRILRRKRLLKPQGLVRRADQ
jgi:hypothetical protein